MNRICRLALSLGVTLVVALALVSPTLAATLYVDAANTSGIEDGTLDNPFDTIPEAMAAALENDTISVARGIYYGQIRLNGGVKLISQEGPQVTILDGLDSYTIYGYNVPGYHDYLIKGFTLTGSSSLVALIRTYHLVMEDCIFRDSPSGLYLSLASSFAARNCLFTNISGLAVHAMYNVNGGVLFENVTFDNVGSALRVVYSLIKPYNVSISNVSDTALIAYANYYGIFNGSHVNFWNCAKLTDNPAAINIANQSFSEPLYVNPPADYHLQAGSPLIDAGIDVGLPYVGAAPDIGAYEYTELTLPEQIEELAASFASVSPETIRGPEEQRQAALYNKFDAILKMVYMPETADVKDSRLNVLKGSLAKLQNDVLAKIDGSSGGNPANDWIADGPEKIELYGQVLNVIADIEAELAAQP